MYGEKYGCSLGEQRHLHHLWLVIEEAVAADANRTFYCKARSREFFSGWSMKQTNSMNLMPGMDIHIIYADE